MTLSDAILLGILQGLTEFLPVSSSGHLVLAGELMDLKMPGNEMLAFVVLLHGGTLVAVVLAFWAEIKSMLTSRRMLLLYLFAASVPAAAVGLKFKDQADAMDHNLLVVGGGFLFTALLLALAQSQSSEQSDLGRVGIGRSILIGLMQALAILPGVSRAGSTMAGGMFCGLSRQTAVSFGFLMALPVIGGAVILEGKDIAGLGAQVGVDVLAAGFFAAMLSGLAAIWMVRWLVNVNKLYVFVFYLIPLGLLTLALHYGYLRS